MTDTGRADYPAAPDHRRPPLVDDLTPDRLRLSYAFAAALTHRAIDIYDTTHFVPDGPEEVPRVALREARDVAIGALDTALAFLAASGQRLPWLEEVVTQVAVHVGTVTPSEVEVTGRGDDPDTEVETATPAPGPGKTPRRDRSGSHPFVVLTKWVLGRRDTSLRPSGTAVPFVADSLAPGTLILLAGILWALDIDDDDLVSRVEEFDHDGATYRVSYNLACHFSTVSSGPRNAPVSPALSDLEKALEALARSLRTAPPTLAPQLAAWASRDPSLATLRGDRRLNSRFRRLLANHSRPDAHHES